MRVRHGARGRAEEVPVPRKQRSKFEDIADAGYWYESVRRGLARDRCEYTILIVFELMV